MPTITRTVKGKTTKVPAQPKSRQPSSTTVARGRNETPRLASSRKAEKAVKTAESNGHGVYQRHEYKKMNVRDIVRRIKDGETLGSIKDDYGALAKIRVALAKAGYDTKGKKFVVEPIRGSGVALAKRVAKQRENNQPWYVLEMATGKTEAQIRALLTEHGYDHLTYGRVRKDGQIIGNVNGKTSTGLPPAIVKANRANAATAKAATAKAPRGRGRPAALATAKTVGKVDAQKATKTKTGARKTAEATARARRSAPATKSKATPSPAPKRTVKRRRGAADPSLAD